MVSPSSLRIPRVRRYSGSGPLAPRFAYRILTFSDRPSHAVRLRFAMLMSVQNPVGITAGGLASSDFARHYFRNLV